MGNLPRPVVILADINTHVLTIRIRWILTKHNGAIRKPNQTGTQDTTPHTNTIIAKAHYLLERTRHLFPVPDPTGRYRHCFAIVQRQQFHILHTTA